MTLLLPAVPDINHAAARAALARQDVLTKPRGSLGKLEQVAATVAGIQGSGRPGFERRYAVVAAADHGVVEEGVSAYPQAVTAQMVANFLSGGAAINVLAGLVGAEVLVVNAGVASELPADSRVRNVAVAKATANFAHGPAMSRRHAELVVSAGIQLGSKLAEGGRAAIVPGDMGIGNTTAAAAITAAVTGAAPPEVTGRGAGVDDDSLNLKIRTVEQAVKANRPDGSDGMDVLEKVGGYEIGFLAGLMVGAASMRGTIILDGFISTSAALIAALLEGKTVNFMIAGHRSVEPGHSTALEHLGLEPLLDLGMRLGEGTGGVLALQVIDAALALHNGMATFEEASISGPSGQRTGKSR